jgi:hypothetical protein
VQSRAIAPHFLYYLNFYFWWKNLFLITLKMITIFAPKIIPTIAPIVNKLVSNGLTAKADPAADVNNERRNADTRAGGKYLR